MATKALVVLSGGQDSTTCLYWAKNSFDEVRAITFHYNQRHSAEVHAAKEVAWKAGLAFDELEIVRLGAILKGTSPLVSDAALEEYAHHSVLPDGLEKTFVPMRNQLFLTIAANRAYCLGINSLVTGVCEEDFGGYPDCRRAFIDSLEDACCKGAFTGEEETLSRLRIYTPLMYLTKADTVKLAQTLPGCLEALAYTHTAYDGKYPPTGKDHASLLRAKGFEEAGIPDPLVMRAYREGLMDLPGTKNYIKIR